MRLTRLVSAVSFYGEQLLTLREARFLRCLTEAIRWRLGLFVEDTPLGHVFILIAIVIQENR